MIEQKIWRLDNMACAGPNGELEDDLNVLEPGLEITTSTVTFAT